MKTIWDEAERRGLLSRLSKLQAATTPRWGKFNATQMVEHLTAPMRAAMGEMAVAPKNTPFKNPVMRYLVIYWLPWPQGAPTAPEFIPAPGGNFEVLCKDFNTVLDRFVQYTQENPTQAHPAFGDLTREYWGVLTHRHIDHHLRQFGV